MDFIQGIDLRVCNRKVLESLIKSGSLDGFGMNRAQTMAMLDQALEVGSSLQRDRTRGQYSFFSGESEESGFQGGEGAVPGIPEWPESQKLGYERELIGFYVTAHPLSKYSKVLKNHATALTDNLAEFQDQTEVTIGGVIDSLKEILTKKGDKMAFVTLQDLRGTCEIVVFPETYSKSRLLMVKDAAIFVRGKINARDDTPKILAEEIVAMDEVQARFTRYISIDLQTAGLDKDLLKQIKNVLSANKGSTPVYFSFKDPAGKSAVLQAGDDLKVKTTDELLSALEALSGENSVKIR